MNNLIKIEERNGEQLVSGRELHRFLEVKSKFIDWFERMKEYGFTENIDFIKLNEVSQKKEGSRILNREQIDYLMKISMSKEISMLQRSAKGKEARLYFIECENKLRESNVSLNRKDSLLLNIIKSSSETERAIALNKYELEYVKPLEQNLVKTQEKLEHKQEVVNCLVDEVKLKTQRQFLNEIIKMKGGNYVQQRWSALYKVYEQQEHINLKARIEAHNLVNKPKIKSQLEYIDVVRGGIPKLYAMAVKLFESDFKNKLKQYHDML